MSEDPRVLLYIAGGESHAPEVDAWLRRLEAAGLEITHAAGLEAGRAALRDGVVSVLVLDQSMGRTSCSFLLREGHARNPLAASFVLRARADENDESAMIEAGASGVFSHADLASLELDRLLPGAGKTASSPSDDTHAFMSRISHEIRTPLHGIHGAIDLLEGTGITPLQRDYIQIVRNAADALMSVVNDLVDYGNPRTNRAENASFPFEPRTCTERVAEVEGPKAAAKGLEFVYVSHFNVPWRVKGNPNALRQILNGLCGYVIRQTGSGAVVLETEATALAENTATLRFRIGVERSDYAPAFPDHDETPSADPDDLSLERCSELAGELGGQLETSMTSAGTMRFEFSVPFEALPDALPLAEVGMEALEGREVLVVDDTVTNRVVYREQLANWGCEVTEAANGTEALEAIVANAARGACFDIALIDFAMPDLDGEALARAIRALPNGQDMRLVLCTSTPRGGDAARMVAAGFEAYLTKPVRFDCLRKVMCLLLGRPADRERTPLITQHVVAEMDRAARSTLYIGGSVSAGRDALVALQRHEFPCDTARLRDDVAGAMALPRYGSVLIDCRGSLEDGLKQAARIRDAERSGRIPVLMILRCADIEQQTSCLAAGGDAVLVEPLQREELVSMMNTYLGLEEMNSFGDVLDDWELDAAMAEQPGDRVPIDVGRLDEITAGDAELRQELIEMFVADTEQRFTVLETAIANEDGDRLNRTAHSIKGSCANMGAPALQALAYQLESMGSENRFDEAPSLFEDLRNEFEVVKVFFGTL